ncbi:MAG TPA: TlpA disulfide reductase family protein [Anaeromyxobacteraceae bacterium]|nr:TlpA disulfide reductase family protein [Anaeromyxobacteraceae bacterium]
MAGENAPGAADRPKRSLVVTAAAIAALALAALGWKGWQVLVEEPRRAEEAVKAFGFTPAARPGPAPAALGTTPGGKPFTVGDAKGQVLFVNFWATWCPPCREEMPSMLQLGQELAARHPGKFRMVAVSVDEEWPIVQKFFGGRLPGGVEFLLDVDQSVTRQYYCAARGACPDSFKFPETYIVDARGNLVSYVIGPRDWSDPAALRYLDGLFK